MGRKCGVQGCLSDSNRLEDVGVTFHKVPMQIEVRVKWLELCRIPEEKKTVKVIYVCSRHFLRADFCNFKGKKYMLRQGVFPSVFPWDKSKLEAIKSEKQQNKVSVSGKSAEMKSVTTDSTDDTNLIGTVKKEIKEEAVTVKKEEFTSEITSNINIKVEDEFSSVASINFAIDNQINALDFNNRWHPARIVEIDEEENEVLIHFENNATECDEWICMDSPRLRPFGPIPDLDGKVDDNKITDEFLSDTEKKIEEYSEQHVKTEENIKKDLLVYETGERCLAYWSDKRKFPATVTKVLEDDSYEVLFDDGYVKCLKSNRMLKIQQHHQQSPLFDPIQSTKQERRDKKRKINVAELFGIGKRQRSENSPGSPKGRYTNSSTDTQLKNSAEREAWNSEESTVFRKTKDDVMEDNGSWLPRWIDGHPVGIESSVEFHDGVKKTFIVPDPRLPEGWTKHLLKRYQGMMAGKWETLILSPDGKRFRSRTDIKNYLEANKQIPYEDNIFDFRIYRQRQKKVTTAVEQKKPAEMKTQEVKQVNDNDTVFLEKIKEEEKLEEEVNLLKIPIVDDAYKCPIEGCGKNFRKENLAQMHVKHYHPEYSKFLDTTPNVADLAYARTVGDSLDKSPVLTKTVRAKTATPKAGQNQPQSPGLNDAEQAVGSPNPTKNKDSEIIKLLNTKPYDSKSEGEPLPSGLPPDMYPDIKLKDLLSKSEGIPKRDDLNLRTLSTTRPPAGIKTLLPVRKPETKIEESALESVPKIRSRNNTKRKRPVLETLEPLKAKEVMEEVAPLMEVPIQPSTSSNIIMEEGQLIKIVRMKQEEIINCTCGFTEEDGLMIQCELCLCWQHAYCNNIQKESQVPEKYVCYICQHPLRQRNSRKFYHDQDWLKQGTLPVGSYHVKDEEALQKRFEKLKKSHDISGGLVELQEFVNTLKVKLKIAEAKNHPKLYLWSKPWEKLPLPEKAEESKADEKIKEEFSKHNIDNEEDHQLKKDLESMIANNQPQAPIIPQPEAAIESADCRLNLLDHILHSQDLVMQRLDDFEKQLDQLDQNLTTFNREEDSGTRQTLQMLMRDLTKLEELGHNTSI